MGVRNGVNSHLRQWSPFIICFWCLAHKSNLTVKDAAIEVTEVEHFKNLMHSVYHYLKNNAVRENIFKKLQDAYKVQSLNILENKDQRWLALDAASRRI